MSEIIEKLKRGVSGTGSKVKNIMDVSRFNIRIAQKQDQIEEEYREIGKLVYQGWMNKSGMIGEDTDVGEHCRNIDRVQEEIDELSCRINEAKKIKECGCGEIVSLDTKYCPECGYKFEE